MVIRSYLFYIITGLSSLGFTTRKYLNFGGVLFGTNESHVQLWSACDKTGNLSGIFRKFQNLKNKNLTSNLVTCLHVSVKGISL